MQYVDSLVRYARAGDCGAEGKGRRLCHGRAARGLDVRRWPGVMATAVNEFSGREREEKGLRRLQCAAPACRGLVLLLGRAAGSFCPPPASGGGSRSRFSSQAEPLLLLVSALRRLRAASLRGLPAGAALRLAL